MRHIKNVRRPRSPRSYRRAYARTVRRLARQSGDASIRDTKY